MESNQMNKKYFAIIFIVLLLTVGSVSAANLERHNFDNYFTMEIPEGTSVEEQDDSFNEDGINHIMLSFIAQDWLVFYFNTPMLSGDSVTWVYQSLFSSANDDLDTCIEYQDGNFRILQPKNEDGNHVILIGTHSEDETIILMGTDFKLSKEMANTIEY